MSHNPHSGAVVHSGGEWLGPKKVIIPDLYDPDGSYLVRYVIFRTPWFGIQIHHIIRSDADRHVHNHPRVFWSFVLKGGYSEERRDRRNLSAEPIMWSYDRFSLHKMDLDTYHSIRILENNTWTFLLTGPKRQEWGFLVEDGWAPIFVHCDSYLQWLREHDGNQATG